MDLHKLFPFLLQQVEHEPPAAMRKVAPGYARIRANKWWSTGRTMKDKSHVCVYIYIWSCMQSDYHRGRNGQIQPTKIFEFVE